jgi:hypothetical protein
MPYQTMMIAYCGLNCIDRHAGFSLAERMKASLEKICSL